MPIAISVDLAGILGDAWRVPKVGRCRMGCGMGSGVPSPADKGDWGNVVSSPVGSGAEPREKTDFGVF